MRDLVVIGFDDEKKAEELRNKLIKLEKEYLIDLEDAVVAVKNASGKVRINQSINTAASGALMGSFWGSLIGLIFLSPFLGAVVGGASGAISGALTDVGIDDKFMKELAQAMHPGSSALFILVRDIRSEKVLKELEGYGGEVIKTSLAHEDENNLQKTLAACKETSATAYLK